LIGFLAYLEPKLWLRNRKLAKKFTSTKAGEIRKEIFEKFYYFLAGELFVFKAKIP